MEACLRLWNRSKQGYEELHKTGFFMLPSGRTLRAKKGRIKQAPGIHSRIFEEMKEQGEASLKRFQEGGHGDIFTKQYQGWESCPFCDGAAAAGKM